LKRSNITLQEFPTPLLNRNLMKLAVARLNLGLKLRKV
jgi:hypothetical protein